MLLNYQKTQDSRSQLDTSHGQHQGHQHQDQVQGQGQTIAIQEKLMNMVQGSQSKYIKKLANI